MEQESKLESRLGSGIQDLAAAYLRGSGAAGVVVALYHDGETLCRGFGTVDGEGTPAPGPDTLFEIGSVSKVFTALLLAQMAQDGEVKLDDPASRYLPPDAGDRLDRPAPVTLRHLATHTSGLPRLPDNLYGPNLREDDPYAHYGEEELWTCLRELRRKRPPGSVCEYSNLGSGLLGTLLARAAGIPWPDLVRERICRPLGMSDTDTVLRPEQEQRLAPGHDGGKRVPPWNFRALAGAGALRSTAPDMLRFITAQVGDVETPLAAAIAETHRRQRGHPYFVSGGYYGTRLMGSISLTAMVVWRLVPDGLPVVWLLRLLCAVLVWWVLDSMAGGWLDARFSPMALGWHEDSNPGGRVLWHNGGTGGCRSYTAIVPARRAGVIVLANSTCDVDSLGSQALAVLLAATTPGSERRRDQ